jgi:hypothetical protein
MNCPYCWVKLNKSNEAKIEEHDCKRAIFIRGTLESLMCSRQDRDICINYWKQRCNVLESRVLELEALLK